MDDHYTVDIRNTICPYPKYVMPKVLEKMRETGENTVIDILVDCPSAIDDLPSMIDREGYINEIRQIADGEWIIRVKKI